VIERAPLPEILKAPERGRVLLVAPHPDDDVLGAGGTCALHAGQGDPVHVLVAYDGLAGDPDDRFTRESYIELRRKEARAGGKHLGLERYEFWDYPEGHEPGPEDLRAAFARVTELVRRVEPDIVYAPWIRESHVDHHVLARVVQVALHAAGFQGRAWGYEVWTPLIATRIVDITPVFERKQKAMREHLSQLRYRPTDHFMLGINANRAMYLPDGTYGEAFSPLGPPAPEDLALLG